MPNNYVLLERIELNASAASVVFANIPQTGYTDLKVVYSARTNVGSTSDHILMQFNGSTTSLTGKRLVGNGSAAASYSVTTGPAGQSSGNTSTANTFGNGEIYIPNYAGSANKSWSADGVSENNATSAAAEFNAGLWSNTSAITSIKLFQEVGTAFLQYSTFSLYGLAALGTTPTIAPKASGGNRIDNDGTYWYHTFTSSGTFTPAVGLTCDVLVTAGGGGGGAHFGGGGGAGGFQVFTSQSVAATAQTITVGAGGAGGIYGGTSRGATGSNTSFGSLTSTGGGGGGGRDSGLSAGLAGGSGGGGTEGGAGGAASPSGQGNSGGTGNNSPAQYGGGGGGGAGAVGQNGTSGAAGNGGAGLNTYSTWASATSTGVSGYYAGGGGAGAASTSGTGGAGGGGNGGTTPTNGTVNTGGGGGGVTTTPGTGAAGGSGIVIVRYPI